MSTWILLPGTHRRPGEGWYTHTHTLTLGGTLTGTPCRLAPPLPNAAVTFLLLIKGMICAMLTFYLINHLHKAIKSHHLKRFLLVCHVPNRLWYIKEVTWWCILKYGHLTILANFPTFILYIYFFGERTPDTNEVSAHACKWFLLPIRVIRFV